MIINKFKNESTETPQEIQVRKLSGNLYEFIGNFNITSKQIERDNELVTVYESDLVHITSNVENRNDMIVALIRLRYTQDAEFAVINKGIANAQDEEYLQYRNYVTLCKEQANVYGVV
jgi:ABC-type Fe3+/spermidine/putrescine transport system ATPase subunit